MDPTNLNSTPQAVEDGILAADVEGMEDTEAKQLEAERAEVKALREEYDEARKFDEDARKQYALDRLYANGTRDPTWAVNTNLIGSHISILTSFLYARDPDVSIRKAPQVVNTNTHDADMTARTLELVVSNLWKRSALKKQAQKQVRSALSVGPGWLKVIMVAESTASKAMQSEMNDLQQNLDDLRQAQELLAQGDKDAVTLSEDEIIVEMARVRELEASLTQKMEVMVRKYLAVDFVPAEDVQVSLDVAKLSDYTDADWVANRTFVRLKELRSKFERLTKKDVNSATQYYRRKQRDNPVRYADSTDKPPAEAADQYVTGSSNSSDTGGPAFACVVELWDRRTGMIKTFVDGVDRWAVEPYQPPYPTTRFYPYFYLGLFEVDGDRHPQSLSHQEALLQDEYARARSNFRLARERSIPGVIFHKGAMTPEDARAVVSASSQELIGVEPTNTDMPLQNIFMSKPVGDFDPRIYDTSAIQSDMEKIAGVQDALQSSVSTPKTATEAEIQQTGFASRTSADRDTLEDMMTQLAQYTAESAMTALTLQDVQKICGEGAFWPEGIDVEDLLTMVNVDIKAGTTGKPRAAGDREAWGVVMPQLQSMIMMIKEASTSGNIDVANALAELVRETMRRFGDDIDLDKFLPAIPAAGEMPGMTDPMPALPPGGDSVAPGVAPEGAEPAPIDIAALVPELGL